LEVRVSTKVTMPQLGESVLEGTVGKWLVKEGDRVEKDQPLVETLHNRALAGLSAQHLRWHAQPDIPHWA